MNKTRIAVLLGILIVAMSMATPASAKKEKEEKCVVIDFRYTDGHTDQGKFCDTKKDLTQEDQGLHVESLHVSCSDKFEGGEGQKSDLDGHIVEYYSIKWYEGDELKKSCEGGEVPVFGTVLASALAVGLGALAYVGVRRRK